MYLSGKQRKSEGNPCWQLKKKNPDVQIVLTAISLDTMAEVMEAVDEGLCGNRKLYRLQRQKARKLGRHHMMTGQNPIYIISEEKREYSKNF